MSSDQDIGSANRSQTSFDSSEYNELDEIFDLDRPPTIRPFKLLLSQVHRPSQLILVKKNQTKVDSDSGFDFTSTGSSGTFKSETQNFNIQQAVSSQSTVSASDEFVDSDETESNTQWEQNNQIQNNESSEIVETAKNVEEDNQDEEMPLSGVAVTNETEQTHSFDEIPDSILTEIEPIIKLCIDIKANHSDYSFVYALAANMCKDIYPKNSYISLKTALLLSIVSCSDQKNAQPISIMLITRDSAIASSIMSNIGSCARRFICINTNDLKFNGKCAQTNRIEANSLLLARNGVCYIGDWVGLKPSSLNYLQNVVDSGRVTVDPNTNIEYTLNCAVWMYWSCSAKKMSKNEKDLSFISKLFGIPIVLDETPGQDVINFLFAQCTTNAQKDDHDDGIEYKTIKTYLEFVSEIQTEFSAEASALLKLYFIVTRALRPNILTPKSFDILQRLSECHSKLCLRTEVLKLDVMFAIELFEQFVLNLFGGQILTKPSPNISPSSFQQVDDNMREFEKWLTSYLSNINENIHTFFQENL